MPFLCGDPICGNADVGATSSTNLNLHTPHDAPGGVVVTNKRAVFPVLLVNQQGTE